MRPTDRRAGRLPLRRAIRVLREQSRRYRRLVYATAIIAVFLASGLAYALLEFRTTAVSLGAGPAGVIEHAEPFRPLAAYEVDAEQEPVPLESLPGKHAGEGAASFYGDEFAGRRTASGERFVPEAMTAAHRTLPLGSKVRVTNLRNGRSIVVRINDRGPFHGNRVIDLSKAAARELGFLRAGTAPVEIELITVRS